MEENYEEYGLKYGDHVQVFIGDELLAEGFITSEKEYFSQHNIIPYGKWIYIRHIFCNRFNIERGSVEGWAAAGFTFKKLNQPVIKTLEYTNYTCRKCGSAAYLGFNDIECPNCGIY